MGERKPYSELFRDPRWQRKRLEIMERDEWKCRSCGDESSTLNVHHLFYLRAKQPWEYPGILLVTLCESCHKDRGTTDRDELENLGTELAYWSESGLSAANDLLVALDSAGHQHVDHPFIVWAAIVWAIESPASLKGIVDGYVKKINERAARASKTDGGA